MLGVFQRCPGLPGPIYLLCARCEYMVRNGPRLQIFLSLAHWSRESTAK